MYNKIKAIREKRSVDAMSGYGAPFVSKLVQSVVFINVINSAEHIINTAGYI